MEIGYVYMYVGLQPLPAATIQVWYHMYIYISKVRDPASLLP